jgi:type IV secretory pathway VirJ component
MRVLRAILILAALGAVAIIIAIIRGSTTHAPGVPTVPGVATSATAPVWTPVNEQRVNHGRFENLSVYMPHAMPRGFVLLLSGAEGWNQGMSDLGVHLAQQGAMVAGIDLAQLNANLEADGADCVFPDGDLENLSHFLQAYYHLPTYLSPILAGYSAGATLAYATLAQAPVNTFAAGVSMEFCPSYASRKHLCKSPGFEYSPRAGTGGVDFLPSKQIGNPWVVLQSQGTQACDVNAVRSFVAQVPKAQLVIVPGAATSTIPPVGWPAAYETAFDTLITRNAPAPTTMAPSALGDLPVIELAAQPGAPPSNTFAIMLSGDGGWAGLDKDVAAALTADGIPVIGLDSLRYFWSARTPDGLAADLDRMIRYYISRLGKQRVMLVGYSQGADVLPFAVNRLSPDARRNVALAAIMGMSEHALFEFHMSSWVSDDNSGPATLPEVDRITDIPVLCIYGEDESDSLCPKLDPHRFIVVKLKGGHHFDGNYDGLARTILTSARH